MRRTSHAVLFIFLLGYIGNSVTTTKLLETCSQDSQCEAAYSRCSATSGKCECLGGFTRTKEKCQPVNYNCPFGEALQRDSSLLTCVLYRSLTVGPDRLDDTCPTGSYCQPFDNNLVGYTEGFCCPKPEIQCPIGLDQSRCEKDTNCTCNPITNYFYGVEIITSIQRLCCAEPCPFGASGNEGICSFDSTGHPDELTTSFGIKCAKDTQCKAAYSQCSKGLCNCKKGFSQKSQKCWPKEFKCPIGLPLKDVVCTTAFLTTSSYTDDCPKGTFCLRNSLVLPDGHCCPDFSLKCPVGNRDLTAACGGPKNSKICDSSTHYCYEAKVGSQIPSSICCPKPCVNVDGNGAATHNKRIAVGSVCYTQTKAKEKCASDNECLQSNAVCEAGACKCHPGLKNFNGTCLATDIETSEGVYLRKVNNDTTTVTNNQPILTTQIPVVIITPQTTNAVPVVTETIASLIGTSVTSRNPTFAPATSATRTDSTPSAGDPDCVNQHRCCKLWGANGECQTNTDYMNTYCSKACGQCFGVYYPGCVDDDSMCLTWARNGECLKNLDWMEENCPVSCKVCSRTEKELKQICEFKNGVRPVKECKNFYENCIVWSEKGECARNPFWMSTNCPVACGKCTPVASSSN